LNEKSNLVLLKSPPTITSPRFPLHLLA
jgi:hypothetical protein